MKNIDKLIEEIGLQCKEKRYSLVTSESCTGGGIAYFITKHPKCSCILERGYIVYSISSKEDVLGISSYSIQTFGAVSKGVAIEMAENSLKKSKAQISIAITGIGEDAAKKDKLEKPGIVWVSCAGIDKKTITKKFFIKGGRESFCEESIIKSLKMLLDFIT